VPDSWLGPREDSLRRIAALVAGGAASADVFAAMVREVAYVVGVSLVVVCRYDPDGATATVIAAWSEFPHPFQAGTRWPLDGPTLLFQVLKTGRPARIDDFTGIPGTIAEAGRKAGFGAAAGAPIIVDGEIWGAMMANAGRGPVPDRMEERLAAFTELLATAISNTESRAALARLAEEQAALRRVATLVARGVAAEDVFAAVAEEVGRLLPVEYAGLSRYEPDGALSMVARSGRGLDHIPVGSRWTLGGKNVATVVFETGRPARIDSYADLSDPGAATAFREVGVRSAVGTPIVVDGRVWAVMIAGTTAEQPLPADTEARLASFTELLATAIANAESRAGLARLAEEQAALRRVATLVAGGARPEAVFAAVANEVARLLSADLANVIRYESDETVTLVASAGDLFPVGSRWPLAGQSNLATLVSETGCPARIDNYADATGPLAEDIREEGIRSAVGTPIIVEGRLWGLITAGSSQEQPLPPDTEARLGSFTELVATAIANAEARAEVGRLVDEQAALRPQWAGSPLRLTFWVDLALLVPASIAIWAMPESVVARSHPRLRPHAPTVSITVRATFIPAALAGFAGFAVLGLFTAVAPAFLGQGLGVTSRAVVGLVVFAVFAASTVGQAMLALVPEALAIPAGCLALIAGMGSLALGLGFSSLALLVTGGVIAGFGHGLSFRAGLAAVNARSPAEQRAEVASSFFVVMYIAISLPVIGEGVLAQETGLRAAGLTFAALVAGLSAVVLILPAHARRRAGRVGAARRAVARAGSTT
jgi:GAF domain-containing protein